MPKMAEAGSAGCSHEQSLSVTSQNQMGDCMSGKLGFLGSFLVSMPESLFSLIVLAFVLAFVVQSRLVKEIFSALKIKVRWRYLYSVYLNEIRIKFLKTTFFWLTTVSRPVSNA
ncbi:MAG: hypothetical protein WC725_01860 [Patescibacteria group bacterium]